MSASLSNHVNSVVEDLQAGESLRERDILGIQYEVTESGNVTEVIAVLTVGGPHIEVDCLRGVVRGQWSGDTFRRGFESDEVREYGRMLADRMEDRID